MGWQGMRSSNGRTPKLPCSWLAFWLTVTVIAHLWIPCAPFQEQVYSRNDGSIFNCQLRPMVRTSAPLCAAFCLREINCMGFNVFWNDSCSLCSFQDLDSISYLSPNVSFYLPAERFQKNSTFVELPNGLNDGDLIFVHGMIHNTSFKIIFPGELCNQGLTNCSNVSCSLEASLDVVHWTQSPSGFWGQSNDVYKVMAGSFVSNSLATYETINPSVPLGSSIVNILIEVQNKSYYFKINGMNVGVYNTTASTTGTGQAGMSAIRFLQTINLQDVLLYRGKP